MNLESSLYCPLAASQIEIDTDGSIRPCCNFEGSFGNIKDSKRKEIFHSESAQSLRKNLSENIKDSRCQFCWKLEEQKIISKRQQSLKIFENYLIDVDPNENKLRSLDLKQSNICNLKCRTCSPYSSSKWIEEYLDQHKQKFGNADIQNEDQFKNAQIRWFDENFWLQNETDLKDVQKIDFYGGEPLLDPYHKPFLKYLIDHQLSEKISLVYGSNGSLLTDEYFEIWKSFKRVKFQVSQDGIEKAFEYMRYPAKWAKQVEVLEKLKNQKQVEVGVTLTYSSLNLLHLPEAFLWLRQNQIDFVVNPVMYPEKFNAAFLPEEMKSFIRNSYNQVAVMHPWMKIYLNEIISFMNEKKAEPQFFKDLLFSIQHADKFRKQSLKLSLPLTSKLFENEMAHE